MNSELMHERKSKMVVLDIKLDKLAANIGKFGYICRILVAAVLSVNMIINAGTAGGMAKELAILDTVISTEVAYHDVAPDILTEFHPWMDSVYFQADPQLLKLSKQAVSKVNVAGKVYWGRMVTGEAFIADEGRQAINEQFSPLSVDMETASIAHVCYVNNVPFIAIRSITDTATHSGVGHFEENCPKASGIAKDITVALLTELRDNL